MRILIDLDGVLADFVGGVCQTWGVPREGLYECWEPGQWDLIPPLSMYLGNSASDSYGYKYSPMSENEFWGMLNGSEKFWLNLELLPWALELVDLVESYTNDWHIVSAPTKCISSYSGKVKWIKRHFGNDFDNFALTPHKAIFSQPGVILIDDKDTNISDFNKEGGVGALFPAYHNSHHELEGRELHYIKSALEAQCVL